MLTTGAGVDSKICTKCKELKTLDQFYMRNDRAKPRPVPQCRTCAINRVKGWKHNHPEKYNNLNAKRNSRNRRKYEAQIGSPIRCSICGTGFTKDKNGLPHFDHNHGNNKARGWLCTKCNVGIGLLGDNPEILKAAARYLEQQTHTPSRPKFS